MSSNQLWFKVNVEMFNDPKIKIIRLKKKGHFIICCFIQCMCIAGMVNDGGLIYVNKNIPYTLEMLGAEFGCRVNDVEYALNVLEEFEIIQKTEEGYLKVINWAKYQNIEALEKIRIDRNNRVAKCRAKKKEEKEAAEKLKKNESNNSDKKIKSKNICETPDCSNKNNEQVKSKSVDKCKENVDKLTECNFADNIDEDNIISNKSVTENNVTCNNLDDIKPTELNVTETQKNVTVTSKNKIKNKSKKKKEKENKKIDESVKVMDEDENIEIIGLSETFEAKEGDVTLSEFSFEEDSGKTVNNTTASSGQLGTGVGQTVQVKQTTGSSEGMGDNAAQYSNCTNEQADAAVRLNKYYESLTGIIGGLDYGQMRLNVIDHGEKYVKMAIDKAISVGIKDGKYISGILKNWRAEGYPKEDERVKNNGGKDKFNNRSSGEDKSFKLKPAEERKLTDEQRKKLEAEFLE